MNVEIHAHWYFLVPAEKVKGFENSFSKISIKLKKFTSDGLPTSRFESLAEILVYIPNRGCFVNENRICRSHLS